MSIHSFKLSPAPEILDRLGLVEGENPWLYNKAWSLFEIEGIEVFFRVAANGEVSFEINGKLDHQGLSPNLGACIIRALIWEWEELLPELNGCILWCKAHSSDGHGERRKKMYKKLGFEEESDGYLYYDIDI